MLHGHSLDHPVIPMAEYVHRYVRTEYRKFSNQVDQILAQHFVTPLREKLTQPLKALRFLLKRVEESHPFQALIQAATTKIGVLRSDEHFVHAFRILRLSNRLLKRWIQRKFHSLLTAL